MNTAQADALQALVSLHDVMPETLGRCTEVLERLRALGLPPITLLVVPGRHWQPAQLATLRQWAETGHTLAAHGWVHEVEPIRGWKHRLHSLIISRNVAEHMALDPAGVLTLMQRSHDWFAAHSLPSPHFYVPPAWALGPLPLARLRETPFHLIETFRGLVTCRTGALRPLPLVGFEADTAFRQFCVGRWNIHQITRARKTRKPLRIGLHPHDFHLRLAPQLQDLLQQPLQHITPQNAAQP